MKNHPRNQEQDVLQTIKQLDYKIDQAHNKRPSVPVYYTDPDLDTVPAGYQWLLVADPSIGATTPTIHKAYDGKSVFILSQSDHTHAPAAVADSAVVTTLQTTTSTTYTDLSTAGPAATIDMVTG